MRKPVPTRESIVPTPKSAEVSTYAVLWAVGTGDVLAKAPVAPRNKRIAPRSDTPKPPTKPGRQSRSVDRLRCEAGHAHNAKPPRR